MTQIPECMTMQEIAASVDERAEVRRRSRGRYFQEATQVTQLAGYMTAAEIAALVKLSRRHVVERLAKRDPHFPHPIYVGGARRYKRADVIRWLEHLEAQAARGR